MYTSMQISIDGDYIFDYECSTVEEVWQKVGDQGSKWYFYPIVAIIKNNKSRPFGSRKIIDIDQSFYGYRGRRISGLLECIKNNREAVISILSR